MSKMIIYFYLLIPMFLSIDSSSIRGRNLKNDLVPLPSSRLDSVKKGANSLKIVSSEPFYIQLQIPKSGGDETRERKEKEKKKQSAKKRVSKIKALRKKHRNRRDLLRSKTKTRQEKAKQLENLHAVSETENKLKNDTKNAISRVEILKALSLHTKKKDIKRNKAEETKNTNDDDLNETKHYEYTANRNHHNPKPPYTDPTPYDKMPYPSTPKSDLQSHKYTYQDLMADRERLEQKLKYIKNMLKVNDSTTDDTVRVRRKSDPDKTANKIAKMFLTLSAVNGLHDKRKSKYVKDDKDEDDRIEDVWDRERKNSLSKKSSSSNEERYKVKKWIEFMKKKRSSSKSCPCITNVHGEEGDAFPLEQKLPKGYFLMERGKSSEESSESIQDPFYSSCDKHNKHSYKSQFQKSQEDQDNKLKALSKNGKKKLELPFDDLELYRSRAKQILRNAEEILDRIKEEEEKRLAAPNILLSQLKELTSKIQGDPRNNENDLIRKIQKNLGWGPLAKSQENEDKNSFIDNVKSFILDPYEKAKALTDESTKKLSSYLLRNLGKLQESSEQKEGREADEETPGNNLQIYFGQVPQKEEKPLSANLAKEQDPLFKHKEDLQNREETISTTAKENESNLGDHQEEQYKQRMEEIIKEQQKKLNEYKVTEDSENNSQEFDGFGFKSLKDKIKTEKEEKKIPKESKPDKTVDEDKTEKSEIVELKKDSNENSENTVSPKTSANTYFTSEKPFLGGKETFRSEKGETYIPASRNLPTEKEFEKEIEEIITTANEKDSVGDGQEVKINFEEKQQSDDVVRNQEQENKETKEVPEVVETSSNIQTNSKEDDKTNTKEDNDVVASPHFLSDEEDNFESIPRFLTSLNDYFMYDNDKDFETPEISPESKPNEETIKQEKIQEDLTASNPEQSMSTPLQDTTGLKKYKEVATPPSQTQILKKIEIQDPSKNETTQMTVGSKKILENAEQNKEPKQNLKYDQQSNEQPRDKIQTDTETLQSERLDDNENNQTDEDITEKDIPETETLKAIENKKHVKNSMEIVENELNTTKGNQKDINENPLLKNPENEKNSNENVNIEKQETSEEDISDETVLGNKSRETWNAEDEEKTSKAEKFTKVTDESPRKNTDSSNEEKLLKKINDEKTENSNESDGTLLKATPNSQRANNEVGDEAISEKTDNEVSEISLNQNANGTDDTNLEISSNKDDESSLKATNLKQTDDSKAEYSGEIGDKELPKENHDEYLYEKTLESEKTDNHESQMKNLKSSDEEGEIIRGTLEKQDDKTSGESNDTILKAVDLQDQETLTANKEASLKAEHPNKNVQLENETSQEQVNNQQQEESNEETSLRKTNPEVQDEKSSENILKATLEDQNEENLEENQSFSRMEKTDEIQDENSDEKGSDETTKLALDDQNEDEIPLRTGKSDEVQDEKLSKQSSDETLKSTLEDQNEEKEEINENETLKKAISDEIQDEESSKEIAKDDQNEGDETPLRMVKSDEVQNEKLSKQSSDETLKSTLEDQNEEKEEPDNIKTSLKMEKPDDRYETQEVKSSDETLKDTLSVQKKENLEETNEDKTTPRAESDVDQNERNSNKYDDDDILKSVLDNETQETLDEESDDETQKKGEFLEKKSEDDDKTDLKVALENQQRDNTQVLNGKETSSQVDSNEDDKTAVLVDPERAKAENLKKPDDDTTYLRAENRRTELNSQESASDKTNSREDNYNLNEPPENFKEVDKALQDEIGKKDQEYNENDTETRLRSENLEDQLDNSIEDDKTLLKSAKSTEETELKNSKKVDENEVIYRERDFDNRIDQKNQDETLRSVHFDEKNDRSEESLYKTLQAINPLEEENNRSETKPEDPRNEFSSSDELQKPGFTAKHFKTGNLKVPKSIGKIMEDLDGKKKDDVTSLQNLNPDKIDHIIDKIDEAEQQTLLTGQQVDCRKECACADEIDTKSRKIGRYEIAKDFLYWMKDLQLNRVLSDD